MLNRIIGILVLLAIGVLVYPYLFNKQDRFMADSEAIKTPPFPGPQAQSDTIKALNLQEKNAVNKIKILKVAALQQRKQNENKYSKSNPKSVAWVIQVGSYTDKLKALNLVNQLRAKGYNAFIHQRSAALGDDIQVYIGPELKRDSAALIASKLAKETKVSGVVKIYKLLSA